jgi:uncharacterized Zn finger protein
VLTQVGWLLQQDPFVLLQLRGLSREGLLAGLHELARPREVEGRRTADERTGGPGAVASDDLAVAEDAALRAQRMLAALEADPGADLGRWW